MDDGYALHTDLDWLAYHAAHHEGQPIAFMRGPNGSLTRFRGGELLVFLRGEVNPHEIGGIATFVRNNVLTLGRAWQEYGDVLGAARRDEFYRISPIANPADDSQTAVLEAENFRAVDPPIRLDELNVEDKQGATRGWYLSDEETNKILGGLDALRPLPEDPGFEEGNPVVRRHLRLERNRHVISLAKRRWLENDPELRCEVCRFSFMRRYGELGQEFIEAHHRTPLNELAQGALRVTRVVDLAPVCGNCHRMLHTRGGRSLDDLRNLLQTNA
jgi:hypothetical protein